jgi:hypothetical protein
MTVPRVFGLPHLSEDAVAAFADGVLSPAAKARAARHCAECAECADAVRGQRETALMLRMAQAPSLPSGLLDRLAGVPMSAPLPPPTRGLPTVLDVNGVPMFVAHNSRAGERREHQAQDEQQHETHAQQWRRGVLPIGLLASAAAVVAAGTLGAGPVQSLTSPGQSAPQTANIVAVLSSGAGPQAAPPPTDPSAFAAQTVLLTPFQTVPMPLDNEVQRAWPGRMRTLP